MPIFNAIEFAESMRIKLSELEREARFGIDQLRNPMILSNMTKDEINERKKYISNGEVIAQATLAMRHIEDARMKYGKVIQYSGDGVSNFDKKNN